jgi:hypothetical protein
MKENIDVLCENYDGMTDEGKEELLTIGERYLNEVDDGVIIETENEDLKSEDERTVNI